MKNYELEFLSKEFDDHLKDKSTEGFSLPLALRTMVDELIALKQAVRVQDDLLIRDMIYSTRCCNIELEKENTDEKPNDTL